MTRLDTPVPATCHRCEKTLGDCRCGEGETTRLTGNEYQILRLYAAGADPEAIHRDLPCVTWGQVDGTIRRYTNGNRKKAAHQVAREERYATRGSRGAAQSARAS